MFIRTYLKMLIRSGLGVSLICISIFCLFAAWLTAGFSARQPQTVFVDFGLSALKILAGFAGLLVMQEVLSKPIQNKSINIFLSMPLSRAFVFLSGFGACLLFVALLVAAYAALMWGVASYTFTYEQSLSVDLAIVPFTKVLFFIVLDCMIVMGFALCVTSISTSLQLPLLLGVSFYMAGHMIGPALDYLQQEASVNGNTYYVSAVQAIRVVVPDLNSLDIRDVVLYSEQFSIQYQAYLLIKYCVYLAFFLFVAVYSFEKREFS